MHWVTGFNKAYYALYREGNVISGFVNAVCVCVCVPFLLSVWGNR